MYPEKRTMTLARTLATAAIAIMLAVASVFAASHVAIADNSDELRAQLAEAEAYLDELFATTEIAAAELGRTSYDLEQTREQIEVLKDQIVVTQEDLRVKKVELSEFASSSYKTGVGQMLDVILASTSFEDFISRVVYMNKISQQYVAKIGEVRDLQTKLDTEKADLENHEAEAVELSAAQERHLSELEGLIGDQESYMNQLSDELVAALEAERAAAAEASRKAAEEAARIVAEEQARAEAEQAQQQEQTPADSEPEQQEQTPEETPATPDPEPEPAPEPEPEPEPEPTPEPEPAPEPEPEPEPEPDPTPSYQPGGTAAQTALNAALSQVGCAYIWGAQIPGVGFDCNGLTNWAWAQAGVSIPYPSGSWGYGQYQFMRSSGRWVSSASALQPGDLVFYDKGAGGIHVAMYVGNYQVVHALSYSQGIQVTPLDWVGGFCGGGSPI